MELVPLIRYNQKYVIIQKSPVCGALKGAWELLPDHKAYPIISIMVPNISSWVVSVLVFA